MKVLLFSEGQNLIKKSGIGKAIKHQQIALDENHVEFTLDWHEEYDVLHINTYGLFSYYLIQKSKRNGKTVIIHAHSTEEDFKDSFLGSNIISPLFKKWLIKVYSKGDQIITPSEYSKELLESYGLTSPIEVLSNGIDLDQFSTDTDKGKMFRHKYGIKQRDKLVISVGLQIKRKGVLDFIEIARKMPDYQFVWCGYTNPLLIQKEVRDMMENAPSNAHFIGYVNDMCAAYSAADLYIMLSHEETEGIVVLEALSIKKDLIVRDIGVFNPWLVGGRDCYKARNNDEFIELIGMYFNNELMSLRENGYKIAKERSLDLIGEQLNDIYLKANSHHGI